MKKLLTLLYSITLVIMENRNKKMQDRSLKITQALKNASERVVVETKATNTYMVISDGKGGIKKIFAKDL